MTVLDRHVLNQMIRLLRKIGRKIKSVVLNVAYNEDRSVASLFGAPPQETISSEIGRHQNNPVVEEAADFLDAIQKDHVENAVKHADKLKAADDGMEQ